MVTPTVHSSTFRSPAPQTYAHPAASLCHYTAVCEAGKKHVAPANMLLLIKPLQLRPYCPSSPECYQFSEWSDLCAQQAL